MRDLPDDRWMAALVALSGPLTLGGLFLAGDRLPFPARLVVAALGLLLIPAAMALAWARAKPPRPKAAGPLLALGIAAILLTTPFLASALAALSAR